ncbi:MAG: biopolymer transport protein ExbD, partial [Pirellulaceae bacterium]
MKVRNNKLGPDEEIELQMTPMIDIVFQLLVFFIMTFKIVAMEGDFNIKMPMAAIS